jgi:hypothetical protein
MAGKDCSIMVITPIPIAIGRASQQKLNQGTIAGYQKHGTPNIKLNAIP